MRDGVYVPNFGPYGDARILADLAYEAEEAGWDCFFLWDQVSKTTLTPTVDPMVDPWIALAAIALRTRTIRLGTLVTPLPRRRPWMVARETVTGGDCLAPRSRLRVSVGAIPVAVAAAPQAREARPMTFRIGKNFHIIHMTDDVRELSLWYYDVFAVRQFMPEGYMAAEKREKMYRLWKKAVTRTFDWVEEEGGI